MIFETHAHYDDEKFDKCKAYLEENNLSCLVANGFLPGELKVVGDSIDYDALSAYLDKGFERAKELGYKVVIVEGNPMNYRSRGFVTSAPFGITAHESVGLPAPECLMVRELVPGGLEGIRGQVCYADYECLR